MKKIVIVVLALVFLVPLTLSAQTPTYDAVTNGTFDTDDSSWTAGGGTTQAFFLAGLPPGSIQLSGDNALESSNDCYVIPGDWPDVGGTRHITMQHDAFNPESNPGSTETYLILSTFSNADCTNQVSQDAATPLGEDPDWQTSTPFTVPLDPSVLSVRVLILSVPGAPSVDYQFLIDNVTAYSSGPNAVTLANMNATSGMGRVETTIAVVLAASAGFLALAGLFRRRLIHPGD